MDHRNSGGGRGALRIRHLPSGVSLFRECPPGVPVTRFHLEMLAELGQKLKAQGLCEGEERISSEST
jgi:hypothetical protein